MINLTKKILPILLFVHGTYAQIDLKTIKDIANSEIGRKVTGSIFDNLDRMRKDYDEASFNYAVALSDNTGLFESEERFKKNRRILLDAFAATQGKDVNNQDKAISLNSIGEMMYASGKYTSAENSFKQAQKLLEDVQDSSGLLYAQIMSNTGLLYHTMGRFTLAEKLTLKAKEIRKRKTGNYSAVYASSLNNQAVLYKDMGHYTEAEELIEKAVQLNQSSVGKESVPYALSLNNQAMIFFAVGRSEEAEILLNQALIIAGKTLKEKSTNYIRLLINLALMKQDMGQYKEAETIYLKAIRIKEGKLSTNHPDYAHLLNHLASLYVLMGKNKEVESNLKKAASIYKKKLGEKHPAYAVTISNLGNFYRVQHRFAEAEVLLKEAKNIRAEVLGEKHPEFTNSLESLGLLYWKSGNTAEASRLLRTSTDKRLEFIRSYFATMSEAEKAKLWQKTRPSLQHFYAFVVSKYEQYPILLQDMYNYQLVTKALLLNASTQVRQQILKSKDKVLKTKYAAWLDMKEELAHAYTLSKEELKEEKINPDSIEKVANRLEKELSGSSKIFSKAFVPTILKAGDISRILTIDEAAIEIIQVHLFDNFLTDSVCYAALILTKENGSNPEMVILKNGNELNKKYLKYYRNSIQYKQKDEHSFTQYWHPIQKSVKARKLYVSLDGVYNQLNINTFQKPEGKYVLDEKEIVVVTNTKEIIQIKKHDTKYASNTALLVGYPDYGPKGTIEKLPGTQKELEDINKALLGRQYKTNYLIKAQAREEKVKDMNDAKIIHFATHGFFLPEPEKESREMLFGISSDRARKDPLLRAGLLLAGAEKAIEEKTEDGILTAFEVTNLSLEETEIVILSACETGLGDVKNGEGVYGLQRAFQVAGANTVVMSLWKVNDQATQFLMQHFYKYYLLSKDKYKAFRQAQAELKTKFKEPLYWGAFVMVE